MIKPLIDQAVDRFLAWNLPEDFHPDAGISFTPHPLPHAFPTGTNLFHAGQAKAMLEHATAPMLERIAELNEALIKILPTLQEGASSGMVPLQECRDAYALACKVINP